MMNNDSRSRIIRRVYWLRKYKTSVGCENCGYNENPVALDFAHKSPMNKHIAMVLRRGGNGIDNLYRRICIKNKKKNLFYLKELINEVRLCKILCKNCHAVETYNNREMHNNRKMAEVRGGSYKDRRKKLSMIGCEPEKQGSLESFFK